MAKLTLRNKQLVDFTLLTDADIERLMNECRKELGRRYLDRKQATLL